MSIWQLWLRHPESSWVRKAFFHIHLWVGIGLGLYVLLMSASGSIIVYRSQLERAYPASLNSIEWLVDLHENLLVGSTGRSVNGIGSIFVTLLCLTGAIIWWPGIDHWRRSLTVDWRGHIGRINWDLHSALGLWFFLFVLMWGISGFYFCFSQVVNGLFGFLDPGNKFTTPTLYWLSAIHFGRFDWFTEALWALLGLVPAILSATGVFLHSHRMIYKSVHSRTNPE
jgi:uncharacterized iron-regulated membrane protein